MREFNAILREGGSVMLEGRKMAVIGGGKMGSVIIHGIVSRALISARDVTVSDVAKARLVELSERYGVQTTEDNATAVRWSDIVILAVKPQTMAEVLSELSGIIDETKVVISIAAGISTHFIESRLSKGVRVIRVMPNTPALIGEGISAISAGAHATAGDLSLARAVFSSVGMTVDVREDLMDAVTGLSGSGPAYAFVIIEALTDAGVQMGLSRDVSLLLSAQTILGAARLCLQGDKHPAELKDMVTSPGGTTIAGLRALEEGKLRATLMAAVEAATQRSRQLGGNK